MRGPRPPVVVLEYLLEFITAEHRPQPNYMDTVALSVRPYVDGQNVALTFPTLFDLDTSVGEQEDFLGQWVGITRYIAEPLDVFFSLDDERLGFDAGKWQTPYELAQEIIRLDDEHYRILLRARIAANYWDGTISGAYAAWEILFAGTGYQILIQDGLPGDERIFRFDDRLQGFDQGPWHYRAPLINTFFSFDDADLGFDDGEWYSSTVATYRSGPKVNGSMHVIQALLGPPMDAVISALFSGGYLGLKSAGVALDYVIQNQHPGPSYGVEKPLFALDSGPDQVGDWVSFDLPGQGHDETQLYYPGAYPIIPGLPQFTLDGEDVEAAFDKGYWTASAPDYWFTFDDAADPDRGLDSGQWYGPGAMHGEAWWPPPYDLNYPLPPTGYTYPPLALAGFDIAAWAWQLPALAQGI